MSKSIDELVNTIQRREHEIRNYATLFGGMVSGGVKITEDYIHMTAAGSSNIKATIFRHAEDGDKYRVLFSDDVGIIMSEYMLKFLFLTGLLYSTIWITFPTDEGVYNDGIKVCICCEGVPPIRNYLAENDTVYYLTDMAMVLLFIKSYRLGKTFDEAVEDTPDMQLTTNSPGDEETGESEDVLTETSGENEIDGDDIEKENTPDNDEDDDDDDDDD